MHQQNTNQPSVNVTVWSELLPESVVRHLPLLAALTILGNFIIFLELFT